jgi:hypothetical protein
VSGPAGAARHGEEGERRVIGQVEGFGERDQREVDVGSLAGGALDRATQILQGGGWRKPTEQRARPRVAERVERMTEARRRRPMGQSRGHGLIGSDDTGLQG